MAARTKKNTALHDERSVLRPRVTEKATVSAELANTYVFDVAANATKRDVSSFVEAVYKVKPKAVRMARVPAKRVVYRGRLGVKGAGKKAYVSLQKGDKIEIV
jgi:large subunit ribosomal protein L23